MTTTVIADRANPKRHNRCPGIAAVDQIVESREDQDEQTSDHEHQSRRGVRSAAIGQDIDKPRDGGQHTHDHAGRQQPRGEIRPHHVGRPRVGDVRHQRAGKAGNGKRHQYSKDRGACDAHGGSGSFAHHLIVLSRKAAVRGRLVGRRASRLGHHFRPALIPRGDRPYGQPLHQRAENRAASGWWQTRRTRCRAPTSGAARRWRSGRRGQRRGRPTNQAERIPVQPGSRPQKEATCRTRQSGR